MWHERTFNQKPAEFASLDPRIKLHSSIDSGLRNIGVERFFTHQAEAINATFRGENVVVATSTASGKSICYNVPVIQVPGKDKIL